MPPPRSKKAFRERILRWFADHRRQLPWRRRRDQSDPHRIWLSEVMLQQTQVSRVEVIYERFLKQFPTLQKLAKASNRDVLIAWRGMGYNLRALRLRDTAKMIVERFGGVFPQDMDTLKSIPGIGPYTAAAIRNFAWDLPTPCADTNIRRILHRVFIGPEVPRPKVSKREILKLAAALLPSPWKGEGEGGGSLAHDPPLQLSPRKGRGRVLRAPAARVWHAALMDFGSLVCTKRSPKCDACPLQKICKSAFVIQERLSEQRANEQRLPRAKSRGGTSRREPGRAELGRFIPNRIYRGRIVDVLRSATRGVPATSIGPLIKRDWTSKDRSWLVALLRSLEHDALIARSPRGYTLPL